MVPADDLAEEAYAVLRDALQQTKKVGLGQLSVCGHEKLASLKPCGHGLIMEVLRYADEVQKAQGYFRGIGEKKPDAEGPSRHPRRLQSAERALDACNFAKQL